MLTTYPLKTYQYSCGRLGGVTPVETYLAYYSDDLPDYTDAEIPFAATSYRMWCPNASKCGVLKNRVGALSNAWHLCPALAMLRDKQALPDQNCDHANPPPDDNHPHCEYSATGS